MVDTLKTQVPTPSLPGLQALLVAGGGIAGGARLQLVVKAAQQEQQHLCADVEDKAGRVRRPKVAVDIVFARRLLKILQMCVPLSAWLCKL